MKKTKVKDEMRPEYKREDLGKGVRGKYVTAYAEAHNIVLLDPDVAKAFPSEEAVNKALLSLMKEAQTSEELTKNSKKRQQLSTQQLYHDLAKNCQVRNLQNLEIKQNYWFEQPTKAR